MTIVYLLLPLSILLALIGLFAFRWAYKKGQLKDLDSPPVRILEDDLSPSNTKDRS